MLICHREARHWEGKHPGICVSLCFVPTLITRLSLSPHIICSQSADLVAPVLTERKPRYREWKPVLIIFLVFHCAQTKTQTENLKQAEGTGDEPRVKKRKKKINSCSIFYILTPFEEFLLKVNRGFYFSKNVNIHPMIWNVMTGS